MSTRTSSVGILFALAACSAPKAEAPAGDAIECALEGAAEFARICTAQRDGGQLVLHRPDGGFHRFAVTPGPHLESLDGAEAAVAIAITNGAAENDVGGDK